MAKNKEKDAPIVVNPLADIFAKLIIRGRKTLEDVPPDIRADTERIIQAGDVK